MFPELEAKIKQAREDGSRSVPTLLGLLSRAERAAHQGDHTKASTLFERAMAET